MRWQPRYQYDTHDTALMVDGDIVAMMLQRVDGTWFARLDCRQPIDAPLVLRDCTDLETGKRGCEEWARRHYSLSASSSASAL